MANCPDTHWPRSRFRVGEGSLCSGHATFSARLLRTSLPLAAVVGTILTGINQGTVILDGALPAELAWKIPLTYLVPFLVSTWSQLRALKLPEGPLPGSEKARS